VCRRSIGVPSRSVDVGFGPKKRAIALALLGGVTLTVACGGGASEPRPVASLGSSTMAARAFARIRDEWSRPTDAGHETLRREIEAFVAAFPSDGLAPLARVYLALSRMGPPEDWARAEAALQTMAEPPPGTAHDLYLVALAKDRRHRHDPDGAFDMLRPLVGKMVDGTARGILEEEVSLDALEAHRDYEAIAYMDAWIRGANEDGRDVARTEIAKILTQLSPAALLGSLRAMRAGGGSHGYGDEIERLVTQRLADVAVEEGDPTLARWLLDPEAGALRLDGDAAIELGELATSKRGLGNVAGRTVGLLLPTGAPEMRAEAADVARGMVWALDLPRTDQDAGDGTRLVTRDDASDADRMLGSLEEIAGEGASIVVTGLDGASADRAIEWAEKKQIALIVLSAPLAAKAGDFTFVIGEPLAPVVAALLAAVGSSEKRQTRLVAPVVEGDAARLFVQQFAFDAGASWRAPVPCDLRAAAAGEPRFPVASWAAAGVTTWLLVTSPECASDVIHEVGGRAKGGVFALSLEAAGTSERPAPGAHIVAAATGVIPVPASSAPFDPRSNDVLAMAARLGGRAGWWAALGRDAGALARKALSTLPLDAVTAEVDILRRRKAARDALGTARVRLWTSDAEGFDASHVLPRSIRVVDLTR
jgi:hypothetical protein